VTAGEKDLEVKKKVTVTKEQNGVGPVTEPSCKTLAGLRQADLCSEFPSLHFFQ
jgi:hypothetical protein